MWLAILEQIKRWLPLGAFLLSIFSLYIAQRTQRQTHEALFRQSKDEVALLAEENRAQSDYLVTRARSLLRQLDRLIALDSSLRDQFASDVIENLQKLIEMAHAGRTDSISGDDFRRPGFRKSRVDAFQDIFHALRTRKVLLGQKSWEVMFAEADALVADLKKKTNA